MQLLFLRIALHLYPAPYAIGQAPCQVGIPADIHYRSFDQAAYLVRVGGGHGVGGLEHFAKAFEGGPPPDDFPEFGGEFEGRPLREEGDFAHFGCFAEDEAEINVHDVPLSIH